MVVSFYRPFSPRSSGQVLAGCRASLSAVAAGHPASMNQSGDLGERALSLGRDYIDVNGVADPLRRQLLVGHDPARGLRDVRGQYTETNSLQVADSIRFQLEQGRNASLPDQSSEHFVSEAGCG